jgi:hypothetical protein
VAAAEGDREQARVVHGDDAGVGPFVPKSGATRRTAAPVARKRTTASHSSQARWRASPGRPS